MTIDKIEKATNELFDGLLDFCIDCGISRYPRKRKESKKYAFYLYGAILAENSNWLLTLNEDEKLIIYNMKNQKPHLAIILGIRPDVIRASLFLNMIRKDPKVKVTFIWSGQHYSNNLKDIF